MVRSVIKRDGRVEEFQSKKLIASISKALRGAGLGDDAVNELYNDIMAELVEEKVYAVTISDRVERIMIEKGIKDQRWFEAAKRFELAKLYNDVYGKGKWTDFDPRDLELTFNAIKVLEARYLRKDPETWRFKETPQMLFRRVARAIASVEKSYGKSEDEVRRLEEKFYNLMSSRKFMPNTPTLMNAGTRLGILSACFVIPVRDSMTTRDGEGIMDALRAQALIHQHGGGTGFDFSELRPENDVVTSSGGFSSGPLSFMKLFDVATDVVKQGGKRRGANMGIMHAWHADIEKFIVSKTGELKDVNLQNFNISVAFYDDFFYRVMNNLEWYLINPRRTDLSGEKDSRNYAIVKARHYIQDEWVQEVIIDELERNGGSISLDESLIVTMNEALVIAKHENAIVKTVNARQLLERIVQGAWDSGDPGFINVDEINRRHPTWYLGKINATNPCVSGDTRILTPEGWIPARELFERARLNGEAAGVAVDKNILGEGGEPRAYKTRLVTITGKEMVYRTAGGDTLDLYVPEGVEAWVWHVGKKPGLRVKTKEGYEVTVTLEHKFLTPNGWKEAKDLEPGDRISISRMHPAFNAYTGSIDLDPDEAFAIGWLIGNGDINERYVTWFFNGRDRAAEERVRRGIEKLGGNPLSHTYVLGESKRKIQYDNASRVYKNLINILGSGFEESEEKRLPEVTWRLKPRALAAFLRGLFTASSYIDGKVVKLTSSSLWLLKEVQILLTGFGIYSYIREYIEEPKISYNGMKRYELVIEGYSRKLFKELIGLEDIEKLERLFLGDNRRDEVWATVHQVEDVGLVDFYDFTVPKYHNYIANGLIHHNCGEEPLLPWEPCNLGSINLEMYVIDRDGRKTIDWEGLARDVRLAVRFLDNVIDANKPPLKQIREANLRTRKVGLGVMGWARLLVKLGIPYDSPDAVILAWHIAEWIAWNAYDEGVKLAREKGPFPAWNAGLYRWLHETLPYPSPEDYLRVVYEETGRSDFLIKPSEELTKLLSEKPRTDWERVKKEALKYGLRNATYLSIAPTGTISIIAGASAGIEPLFALAYVRQVAVGTFIEVEPLFLEELRRLEMDDPEVIETIAETGSVAHLKWVPRRLRRIYKTAHDIDYEWHLLHQAVWQAWVDAGTSKTVNMRHDEPVESVWKAYWLAWRLRIKGTTVYRDRSKEKQVIYFGIKKKEEKKLTEEAKSQDETPKPVIIIEPDKKVDDEKNSSKQAGLGRGKLRLGKGRVKELIVVAENYAGGCPTCDI
ncbi:MAG: hypothetical protein GSR85_04230 [Desulfurococcales archaeon]|nr:hypothetical protein [Desulfurococcales archaeon]